MNEEPTVSAGLHPVIPTPEEVLSQLPDEVGDEEYVELRKMLKLEAAIDFAIALKMRTTYKPVGLVAGWFWRDARFHTALRVVSEKAIARGEGAKSAVVCRAGNDGAPTRPGRQFYEMVERLRGITIPRLPSGDYDPLEAEKVWGGEMVRLGFDPAEVGISVPLVAAPPLPSPGGLPENMGRAATWMMNRLALDYQQAQFPPLEQWPLALNRDATVAEVVAHGLIKPLGKSALGRATWCFTEKGRQWIMAHIQT
jgi:hypothetical protein